jgi:hypothetical protein
VNGWSSFCRRAAIALPLISVSLGHYPASINPSALAQATPLPVDPAECTVEPRPLDDFIAVGVATPGVLEAPILDLSVATPAPPPADAGVPAEPSVIEAVTTTVNELVACLNAGDSARLFALYTDEAFALALGGGRPTDRAAREWANEFTTPRPLPAELRQPLPIVTDVRVLPDGRAVASIRAATGTSLAVFEESGGRYLFDWSYELAAPATPTP